MDPWRSPRPDCWRCSSSSSAAGLPGPSPSMSSRSATVAPGARRARGSGRPRAGTYRGVGDVRPGRRPRRGADDVLGVTLLTGDVLFAGSIGRTDLPGGDHAAMLRSLRDGVLPLPDDTLVLPGHGPFTTIGRERADQPLPARTAALSQLRRATPISGFPEFLPAPGSWSSTSSTYPRHLRAARLRLHRDPCGRADGAALRRARTPTRRSTSSQRLAGRRGRARPRALAGPALRPHRALLPLRPGERRASWPSPSAATRSRRSGW